MRYRIADVCVEVRCPPGVARADVESRYAAFTASGGAADLVVDVEVADGNERSIERPYPGVDARREGDRYRLDRRDVAVMLDLTPSGANAHGRIADAASALDTVLRACLSILLPRRGGLLLHASGVVAGGRAFLFTGPSGAGKSTAAALTAEPLVLSDDIVALTLREGRPVAHAVPFAGLGAPALRPLTAPIEVICLLEQAGEHVLEPLPRAALVGRLIRNILYLPTGDPATAEVLRLTDELLLAIPARRLRFRRDAGFWEGLRRVGGRPIKSPVSLDRPGVEYYDGGSG